MAKTNKIKSITSITAAVDGSYSDATKLGGWATIIRDQDNKVVWDKSGTIENPVSRQIHGELKALIHVLRFMKHNKIKRATIEYDYMGVEKWYTREWKTKMQVSQAFMAAVEAEGLDKFDITFVKVSGSKSNKSAVDAKAKAASGSKR